MIFFRQNIIIDVRSDSEYASGHIKDALNMPHDKIANMIGKYVPDKNAYIILYCRSGKRAETARGILKHLGYSHVENIGGMEQAAKKYHFEIVH